MRGHDTTRAGSTVLWREEPAAGIWCGGKIDIEGCPCAE
jgi:hypothetical protein